MGRLYNRTIYLLKRIKLSKYGRKEWGAGGVIALASASIGLDMTVNTNAFLGVIVVLASIGGWLTIAALFRDPEREIPDSPNGFVSPADGIIADIETVTDHPIKSYEGKPLLRIGISRSLRNVHITRAPANMKVLHRSYKPGVVKDAQNPNSIRKYEALVIAGTAKLGKEQIPTAIRQIAVTLPRKMVCEPQQGEYLIKGQSYGMTKFGTRTELYFPPDSGLKPEAAVGDTVFAGSTILASRDTLSLTDTASQSSE